MYEFENIFAGILGIIYFVCVFIEIKSMKRNKIDISYKDNFLLVLISSCVFPFALFVFAYGFYNLINIISTHQDIEFCYLFLTYIFGSLAYIVGYIRKRIYAFISPQNKLSFLGFGTIYSKEK